MCEVPAAARGYAKRLALCGRAAAGRDDTAALRVKMRIAVWLGRRVGNRIGRAFNQISGGEQAIAVGANAETRAFAVAVKNRFNRREQSFPFSGSSRRKEALFAVP